MKRTGPTNQHLADLIQELRKKANEHKAAIWKRLAEDLSKPSKYKRIVNLYKLNKHTKEGEIIVVPGKVLSNGELNHKLTIAAYKFSKKAIDKISDNKSKAISINQLMDMNIKGKKVKIIG